MAQMSSDLEMMMLKFWTQVFLIKLKGGASTTVAKQEAELAVKMFKEVVERGVYIVKMK